MADPLSVTASTLAIVTASVQSLRSLHEAVRRYKDRDKALARLDGGLRDLVLILGSLTSLTEVDESVLELLQGPVGRCGQVCHEFERSMQVFSGRSKTGLLDWAKMEFMRGGLNDFTDTLADYKSTISVGLGAITLQKSKVTQQAIEQYNEMVQDTMYQLNLQLQRLEGEMKSLKDNDQETSALNIQLNDQRQVTEQCLRICEHAKAQLRGLRDRSSQVVPKPSDQRPVFKAQAQTRQAMDEAEATLAAVCTDLSKQLQAIAGKTAGDSDVKRAQIQADMGLAKQGLELCNAARELSRQKVCRIGEIIADKGSDHVAATTMADIFELQKAQSTDDSALLYGMFSDETLRFLAEQRYASRFGAVRTPSSRDGSGSNSTTRRGSSISESASQQRRSGGNVPAKEIKANSNELRRRVTNEYHDQHAEQYHS